MREREFRERKQGWEWIPTTTPERSKTRVREHVREMERREPGHWNRIRYRGGQQNRSTVGYRLPKETSLLFYNFPRTWGVTELWRLFKRYGVVSDIYMAFKRLRNGEKFGFVRFRGVSNEEVLEERLKKIWFGELNLRVHLANKYGRRSGVPDTRNNLRPNLERVPSRRPMGEARSYVDVVKGINPKEEGEIENKTELKGPNLGSWEAEEKDVEYLQRCAVGSVTRMEHVDSIQALISTGTLENCEIKMLGGSDILIKFGSKEEAEKVIKNKVHGIHYWAKDLCIWTRGYRASKRLVWLRIMGLPLHIWKVEVFKEIASNWGSVVTTINCDLQNSPNLMWGKVLINTSLKSTINEIKSVKVGGLFYVIKVEEEDGMGLESQIRNYHHQIAAEEDDEKEDFYSSSVWSEEKAGSEEDVSEKESFSKIPSVRGSVDFEERNIREGGQEALQREDRCGGSSDVQMERDEVAGENSPELFPIAGDLGEEEQSSKKRNTIITADVRADSSKEDAILNLEGNSTFGPNVVFGPHEKEFPDYDTHDGPLEDSCFYRPVDPNLNGSLFMDNNPIQSGPINKSPISLSLGNKKSNQADPIQEGKTKSVQMKKGDGGAIKSKSISSGARRNKCRLPEKPGFGRGRASLHCFKQMARSNVKKVSKSKQSKRKVNSTGDPNSSENVMSISSELKGNGLSDNIEEFGTAIGVVWKEAEGQTVGLGNQIKKHWVKEICKKEQPCLVGIQETKLKEISVQSVAALWGMNDGDFDFCEAMGNSGGLLTIWNKNVFQGEFVVKDKNFLAVIGKWEKKEGLIGCVNVYGPNGQKDRETLWSKLDILCDKEEVSWVFFGDFNEVRNPQERVNSVATKKGMEDFNNFIRRNKLEDIGLGGDKFTRISDDGRKFSKLDRFLVSSSFGDRWKHLSARTLERKWSDHTPILLRDKLDDYGPIPFKFYDIWLKEDSVANLVKEVWEKRTLSSRPDCIFRDKLKKLKDALKVWRKEGWGEIDKEVELARQEVREWEVKKDVSKLQDSDRENWVEARKKWKELEEKHVAMAKQRAKLKWAKEGDENTKLFHAASKLRERRNRIHGLNIQGAWSEKPEDIKKFVFEFFKEKFSMKDNSGVKLSTNRLKRISEEEALLLEKRFTEEEVWNALNDCGNNKSPGPDGFTTAFLKKFWGIIKGDLMAALDWFWEKEDLSKGCNSSFVTLIPKNTSPIGLNDFRPISLVGILYKVLTKVLAERMKSVLENVISNVQSAFLKGRSILDGVLVANETVSFLKSSRKKGLIFKVDFEKAYDSVSWEFLLDMLEKMGFGRKWRNWVWTCLKSSRISILVNGSPTEEFSMEKGIRQGDPMAPFLFLVVAEGLHIMVEEAIGRGLFKGLKVGNGGVVLSHLQYADDVLFFGEWGAENIVNLIKLLKCFHAVSGLKVNINKCNIFGIGIPEEEVVGWARVIGCGSGSLPFIYLGLPVGASMKRVSHWEKIIIKFKNKLSSWKAKWLSFGGRLSLVKSVLSSLPLYYFSLFHAPVSVIKLLERVRSNFFWGVGGSPGESKVIKKGRAWVKWDKVLESFEWGGLNVGGLREMNWSLIGKWWLGDRGSLWRNIIQSIYGEKGGLELGSGGVSRGSSVWRAVINMGRVIDGTGCNFSRSFGKIVGNGGSTKFWEDRWVGGEVLKERFPRLYNLETCKGALVADRGSVVGSEWVWKWNWRRLPFGREVSELEEMIKWIENFKPVVDCDDKLIWLLEPQGGFSVKALRTILGEKRSRLSAGSGRGQPTSWVKSIPSKINVFFWKAKLERLPCRVLLDKYGFDLDSILCPRCNQEVESVHHALFTCEKVKNLWLLVGRWWNLDVSPIASLDDLLFLARRCGFSSKAVVLWEATVRCFAYMVWSDRNKRIFNNMNGELCDNLVTFQRLIFEWLSQRNKEFHRDWRLWLLDPAGS
ncbi:hypothetical protein OSB04_003249 [Centaurea solstitialis]|uniref:Uncharacterized protein n=1 Tax=Centaurea solstitialis TaxID=347529 RepID=A0AA38TUH4_9ASTR|nr:hypothetical protein OSB04_003249 [Centaurea solstitialis]